MKVWDEQAQFSELIESCWLEQTRDKEKQSFSNLIKETTRLESYRLIGGGGEGKGVHDWGFKKCSVNGKLISNWGMRSIYRLICIVKE